MERVGRYELGRLLGRGGFGRVYEAVLCGPGSLRKPVALKVLERGDGLHREARIGGLLRHPNLVDVYEVGEVDGTWFLALELCDGTLADHLPLPPAAVVDVGLQVCAALSYAHDELGLVHQDLKPGNLLVRGGVVKVGDLGLATADGFEPDRRRRGTPPYMAPEQIRGGPVDARTDIYALGLVLAELATGRRGVAAPTISLEEEEEGAPAPGPSVPGWLRDVVERCTREMVEERYPDADALAADLAALELEGPGLTGVLGSIGDPGAPGYPAPREVVGREPLVQEVTDRLEPGAWVTLKGVGGIGKTTVGIAVGRRWRGAAHVVDLGASRDREGLVSTVAGALGVSLRGGGGVEERATRVGHALASRRAPLLVLDNLEQLLRHLDDVQRWRERAPGLMVLATSRQRVSVPGEVVVEVPPLDEASSIAVLRARAADRGIDPGDGPAVRELVQRLAGIPLALELAAGRLGVLSVEDVLDNLELSLLRAGRTRDDRHATLAGTLAWSWEQLTPEQRNVLLCLAVFRGPFDVEAAEAVVADETGPWVVDVLGELVDHSLVVADEGRLRLLVPVAEFVTERLSAAQRSAVEERHGRWFARLGSATALGRLIGPDGVARFRHLVSCLDDIRAAHDRAVVRRDAAVAAATALAAAKVYRILGPASAGLPMVERALALGDAERGRLLQRRGTLRDALALPGAEEDLLAALARFRRVGDERRVRSVISDRINFHLGRDQLDRAEELIRSPSGAELARDPLLRPRYLVHVGHLHRGRGRHEASRAHCQEAILAARRVGDWLVGLRRG